MAYRATAFRGGWFLPVVYVIVGAFVAAAHHYFSHTSDLAGVVNTILAIIMWPLVLFGVQFHVG